MRSLDQTLDKINELISSNKLHHFVNLLSNDFLSKKESSLIIERLCRIISTKKSDEVPVDILIVDTENTNYKIEDLKSISEHLVSSPIELSYKYVIINEAHKLSVICQNKLLKVLEEPPIATRFIFISNSNKDYLATIKSRFLEFNFTLNSVPPHEWASKIDELDTHDLFQELKKDPQKLTSYVAFITDHIFSTSNFKLCDKVGGITKNITKKLQLNLSVNLEISQLKEIYLHTK